MNVTVTPVLEFTTTTVLLQAGPGSNPAAYAPNPKLPIGYPDAAKGNVAAVWASVTWGPAGGASPQQTNSPPKSCGVFGQVIGVTGAAGVCGSSDGDDGVRGVSTSAKNSGVSGTNNSGGYGIFGTSSQNDGVRGQSTSAKSSGVSGMNDSGGHGVFGTSSQNDAVHGESQSSAHAGVSGVNTAGGYGVYAQSVNQSVKGSPAGTAGIFLGNVEIQGDISSVNTVKVQTDVILQNGDCAEQFDMYGAMVPEPGTIVVINDDGTLRESQCPYDKRVAGVVSGAGEYRPAIVLDQRASSAGRASVSLMGKVYCKVDADPASIAIGDLLTTSARAGFAMKATDPARAFGAVIGKALKPLSTGQGMIPILVALQ
jgi:hypothetical protein